MIQPWPALPDHIETERLILRPYGPDDGPALYRISQRNREHLQRYEADNVLMEIETEGDADDIAADLGEAWALRQYFFLGAWEKASSEFAAQVYLGPVEGSISTLEIGYIADVDHEGQGFASEAACAAIRYAFEALGAVRLQLHCDDTNLRSMRVAERCGFTCEEHSREDKQHPDGTRTGTLCYRLLRSEWDVGQR